MDFEVAFLIHMPIKGEYSCGSGSRLVGVKTVTFDNNGHPLLQKLHLFLALFFIPLIQYSKSHRSLCGPHDNLVVVKILIVHALPLKCLRSLLSHKLYRNFV